MKIAKVKKKPTINEEEFKRKIAEAVMNSNYVCMSTVLRVLHDEYGFRKKRLLKFAESYMVLVEECADHRSGPRKAVQECLDITGVNAKEWIDDAFGRHDLF